MLVNRQGDVMLLLIVQDSDYEQSDPEVTMAESTSNKPCQIEFQKADVNNIVYVGDYICWLDISEVCIRALNLKTYDEEKTIEEQIKTINLELITESEEDYSLIALTPCSPFIMLR